MTSSLYFNQPLEAVLIAFESGADVLSFLLKT